MKIVFLSHDSTYNGGAQICLVDLIKGIKTQNPEAALYIIVPRKGDLIEKCAPYIDGYQIIETKLWLFRRRRNAFIKKLRLAISFKKSRAKILAYLDEIKPDLVVTNTIVVPQLAMAAHQLKIAHVWMIHEIPMLTWGDRQFIYSVDKIMERIDELSSKIIVTSDFARQYYAQYFRDDKVISVDQAICIQSHAKDGRPENQRYTILIVGAIEPNKGQLELLAAIDKIVGRGKDLFCYIVGGINNRKYMENCTLYIKEKNLEHHIEFIPFTTDVAEYYYKSDLLVSCSAMEAFSRTAVEAQLCGLPVVLSRVGANSERVIDGVNGYLYEKGSVDSLVEKIELLRDPACRAEFSNNLTLLDLEKHTPEAYAQNFLRATL